MAFGKHKKWGFTLVELVVVIVIIGILAAIAIPRLSRGSTGAGQAALSMNVNTVRNALNMYATEHKNVYPGPANTDLVNKLTLYTDANGTTSASRTDTCKFGPYLASIPPVPVGPNAGGEKAADVLVVTTTPPTPSPSSGEGWVYNATTGEFRANTADTDKDDGGKAYNLY